MTYSQTYYYVHHSCVHTEKGVVTFLKYITDLARSVEFSSVVMTRRHRGVYRYNSLIRC